MSRQSSPIEVVCSIPLHLVDRYLDGSLELRGGVLRHRDGRIAGILTEGQTLVRQVENGMPVSPEHLMKALGNAQMATHLAWGISVLNLGVQAAGFAVLARRLDCIADQMKGLRCELEQIGEDVQWLKLVTLAELRSDAANAMAMAESASYLNSTTLFSQAKWKADGVRRHLTNLLQGMIDEGRALPQCDLFVEFIHASVLLATAEARCDEATEGAGRAAKNLRSSAGELRRLARAFRGQMHDFGASPRILLRVGSKGRPALKTLASRGEDLLDRLESYVPQLELQDALGLDAKGWQKLTDPDGSALLACIISTTDAERDLVEAVRATRGV